MQHHINIEASVVTVSDINKTKHGTPLIPKSVDGVINVLECQVRVLYFLFTARCPLAIELATIVSAMTECHTILANIEDFQWTIGAEILWHVTRAKEKCFDTKTLEQNLRDGQFPKANLAWLAMQIRNNTVQMSVGRPVVFLPPVVPNKKRPHPGDDRGGNGLGRGGFRQGQGGDRFGQDGERRQ